MERLGKVDQVKQSRCWLDGNVHLKAVTGMFEWTLDGFSQLPMTIIKSPTFSIVCQGNVSDWFLQLDLRKQEDIGIFLCADIKQSKIVEQLTRMEFSLGGGIVKKDTFRSLPHKFSNSGGNGWGFSSFVKRNLLLTSCMKDDQLLVKATIVVYHCHPEDYQRQSKTLMALRKEKAEDFVKIQCQGQMVETSRTLLCAASPVLAARCGQIQTKKRTSGVLAIEDLEMATVNSLLDFLYFGELTKDMDAGKLLAAAHSFEIELLKAKSVERLKENLTLATSKEYWQLATDCNAQELKTAAAEVIYKNFGQLQGDFIVRCQEKDINITKELLRKSPVLATMLDANMSEVQEGILCITDFDFDTVKAMLIFLFIDVLMDDCDAAMLLQAAEKYQIDGLKQLSIGRLSKEMSMKNACEMLALGDLHNAPELKKAATDLIVSDPTAARDTDGWKLYVAKNAQLLDDIFAAVGAKKDEEAPAGRKRKLE